VLAAASVVGAVVAAPFYGCYFGALGCVTCGSAVSRRCCRPKAPAGGEDFDEDERSEGPAMSEAPRAPEKAPSVAPAAEKAPSVAPSAEKVVETTTPIEMEVDLLIEQEPQRDQDWDDFVKFSGKLTHPSGCFCCMFTRVSTKE